MRRSTRIIVYTLENIIKELNMVKVNSHGQIHQNMMESSSRITFTVKEHINGKTEEYTKVNGRIVKWKDTVNSHGQIINDM